MNLAIFDLDGTLTDTNEIDTECFVDAWNREFRIDASNLDWSAFPHVSDKGIANVLCEKHFESAERETAYDRVRERFLNLLAAAASERPASFRAIRGAREMMDSLVSRDWRGVVATGAWTESARIKLTASGLDRSVPVSSSDCCESREEIVRHAMRIADEEYRCGFDRIVLLGDAPWDVSTAANVHLPFVGIAASERAKRLLALGAGLVLPDFSDIDVVHEALDAAQVPTCTDWRMPC